MVPGRLQAAAEMIYEFTYNMCIETIGPEGKRFFPFIFTLFLFILIGNLAGVWPYFFTFTSHISVTLALTMVVIIMVTFVGLWIHKLHFFSYFVPQGVPKAIAAVAGADRGAVLPLAHHLAFSPALRQHDGRPRDAGGVRRLRGACWAAAGLLGLLPAAFTLAVNVALIGFEILVGHAAGLRVRSADLHLPARRGAPALVSPQQMSGRRPA